MVKHPPERPGDAGRKRRSKWRFGLVIHIAPHPLFDIVGQDLELWCRLARGKRRWVLKSPFQHERKHFADYPTWQSGRATIALKGKGLVSKKQTGDLYAVLKS